MFRVNMALVHHERYHDGTTDDRCFHVLVERVTDLLRQGSGRSTTRGADREDTREDGDAPAEDEAKTLARELEKVTVFTPRQRPRRRWLTDKG